MTDPLPFSRGDRVKLTDRYADALNRALKTKIDWRARRGSVARCNEADVYVAWDGRESLDSIPIKGVEKT
jgi:hypothetical protein